jgi:hypothetical protein
MSAGVVAAVDLGVSRRPAAAMREMKESAPHAVALGGSRATSGAQLLHFAGAGGAQVAAVRAVGV